MHGPELLTSLDNIYIIWKIKTIILWNIFGVCYTASSFDTTNRIPHRAVKIFFNAFYFHPTTRRKTSMLIRLNKKDFPTEHFSMNQTLFLYYNIMIFWSWQLKTNKKYPNIPICPNFGASVKYLVSSIMVTGMMLLVSCAR